MTAAGLPDDPFPDADKNDPFVRTFKRLYAEGSAERRKLLLDMASRADFRGDRQRTWIAQLTKTAQTIHENRTLTWDVVFELFWIRLYGALAELPELYRNLAGWRAEIPDNAIIQAAGAAFDAVAEIRDLLSDDEILLLDWLRSLAAHVRQKGYEVRWDPKAEKTDDSRKVDLLGGRRFETDEIRKRIDGVLSAHGGAAEFGAALVDRLEKPLLKLYLAAKAMAPLSDEPFS